MIGSLLLSRTFYYILTFDTKMLGGGEQVRIIGIDYPEPCLGSRPQVNGICAAQIHRGGQCRQPGRMTPSRNLRWKAAMISALVAGRTAPTSKSGPAMLGAASFSF